MAIIDDKVVAMSFDNRRFESGVKPTLASLDKLKTALQFPNAGKGLDNINSAANRVNLGHIATGIDDIKNKLGYLSVAALAVFANIATRAVQTGAQMVKAFTIQPIMTGLKEYETNLNAIQTVLANTKAAGTTLKDVNKALYELNIYSDKTIYNFSEMARNIGTFTAAGVDLKTATGAIKGIANLAALSGSNSQQAATAMYQLSQAISAGRVSLQDWNSVVNAGMGGTVFQRALAQTAVSMGKLKKDSLKLVGPMKNVSINGQSFRQSMMAGPGQQSWLTSDVLTATLKQFTGDLSDAELAAMGFDKAQIKAIQSQAKMAMQAATQVKTLSQVLDVAKETAQSGWAQTWQVVFGDFGEAKKTFTALSNSINSFINASAKARNKVLGDWKALGGRILLITSIKAAFDNLGQVLAPIKEAFRDIFPRKTGKDLYDLTIRFNQFVKTIKPSPETIKNLHRTFEGLFALIDIGKQIIGGILGVFARLFGIMFDGSGSFLEITAKIGDFLVALDQAIRKGDGLTKFFSGLTSILAIPIKLFQAITDAIANMFSGFSPGGFSVQMDGATKAAEPFKKVLDVIVQALQGLGPAISNALSNMQFEPILAVIRTGLFAALVLMIRKFIGGTTLNKTLGLFGDKLGKGFAKNLGGGVLGKLGGAFGGLTGSLKSMQANLKAKTLKEIAIAIALLTASLVALSFIKPERLNASLGAMAILFGELIGAMILLNKALGKTAAVKVAIIGAAMIALATAIDILTIAVFAMSKLSWSELTKGLGGIVILLGTLSAASIVLSKNAGGMIRAGIAIGIIATALNIMALAVKQFGSMDLVSLGKGLGGVAGSLGIIAGTMRLMPKSMVLQGAALILVATALNILVKAVEKFGDMNLVTIGKGLLGIGGGLVIIAGAMRLMPKNMVLTSAGLLLVAVSLGKIVSAVQNVSKMSLGEIGRGMVGLAGALGILAVALRAMSGTLAGSAALSVAAGGVALFVPALISLGRQSWKSIIKSLAALGAGFTVLAVATRLLAPSIPALLGFGAALVLIGGGMALAGAGVALIGVGLSAIAVSGPVAIGILIQALIDLTKAIPKMAKNLVLGLLEIVKEFAKTAPQFVKAMIKIVDSLAEAVAKSAPKLAEALVILVQEALKSLAEHAPEIIQAGFDILMALLRGIRDNIVQITTIAVTIVVNLVNALSRNLNRLVTAGFNLVISFVKGIANNIGRVITAGADIIIKFVSGIANNLDRIVIQGGEAIAHFITGLGNAGYDLVVAGGKAVGQFIEGVGNAGTEIIKSATKSAKKFVTALVNSMITMTDTMARGIVKLLNATADMIDKYEPQIIVATARIGIAIVTGLVKGVGQAGGLFYDKIKELAKNAWNKLKHFWKILSPSALTADLGKNIVLGLVVGLDKTAPNAYTAADNMSNGVLRKFNDVFQTGSPSKAMETIGKYVGEGFAKGLRGSQSDIDSSFKEMDDKLLEAMKTARQTIATERAKLKKLQSQSNPDAKSIAQAQKVIDQNQAILERSTAAHKALTETMQKEKKELSDLAKGYEKASTKLQAAQDTLNQAIQAKNQAIQSYKEQYGALPSIPTSEDMGGAEINQLEAYKSALKYQITATKKYNETLQKLRKQGLDKATYEKLLQEGTVDQAFADQLLAGGKMAIENVNTLDSQLASVSKTLAVNAGNNLYQAGINAARGLVDGLKSKHSDIRKEMESIANEVVGALKRKLEIKSPSRVFAEIGKLSMEGMAKGFIESSRTVSANIEQVADSALTALQRKMLDISTIANDEINIDPTITPILDLTQIRDQAAKMATLVSSTPMSAKVSLDQAAAISSTRVTLPPEETAPVTNGTSINFEQHNYSPEALSPLEIYRQTRNQLSQLRSIAIPA